MRDASPGIRDDRSPGGRVRLGGGCSVDPSALDVTFARGGGPGGQHVNKTSTKAQLRVRLADIVGLDDGGFARLRALAGSHLVGDGADEAILISDQSSRSQADNRDACLARLKTLVSMAAKRPKVRKKTKPTRGSVERRIDAKKREGEKKEQRRWRD
ncbi:MAG: aminoacyl-tRNA hydrolase [Planctomycetaceae bacterium]|jgi:ribosome-associated protein|nr:aminoacyl-tRNA hydrolase [Planctomycetaceae bacterium]